MEKTRIIIISAVVMLSVLSGCERKDTSDNRTGKSRLQLTYPLQDADSSMKMRFGNSQRKDEKAIAYERVAEEWNRNLILGSRQVSEQ